MRKGSRNHTRQDMYSPRLPRQMPNQKRVAAGKMLAAQRFPRLCPHCGDAFGGTRKQIYCSRSCKESAAKIDRTGKTCPVCSSPVVMSPSGAPRKYCSEACKSASRKTGPINLNCLNCGKQCEASGRGSTRKVYCSAECRKIHASKSKYHGKQPMVAVAEIRAKLGSHE